MDLRQLQLFVAVAEEGSFTRAAARVHLAQPGVSARIRQLERELGHVLLDRSGTGRPSAGRSGGTARAGRPVTPTQVGEAVLPYARAALEAAENVRHAADAFTGLLRGHVTVGLVSGATDARGRFDIAAVLADFHNEHPHVEIALTEDTSDRMLRALRHGALDIAVAGLPDGDPPPGTAADIVVDEPVVVAVSPHDPLLSEPGPLPWAALRDRALISPPPLPFSRSCNGTPGLRVRHGLSPCRTDDPGGGATGPGGTVRPLIEARPPPRRGGRVCVTWS
ncbi:LysR family transcriptional regulator, partial [Streptomyces diacarni]